MKANGRENAAKWIFLFSDGDVSNFSKLSTTINVIEHFF